MYILQNKIDKNLTSILIEFPLLQQLKIIFVSSHDTDVIQVHT